MNGYLTVPFKKGPQRINEQDAAKTRLIFGRFIAETVRLHYQGNALVPVPSKDSFSQDDFRSLTMLQSAVPDDLDNPIVPAVRFVSNLLPASQGGLRGVDAVYPHLMVSEHFKPRPVVLIDDIITTGGTILAAKQRLEERGFEVSAAIVCGRTVAAAEKAFFPREFELLQEQGEVDL
ncbi:phosphoribosyltransferase [Nitratireductor sp. B36]|uniref:phosphoribosyltransferase n=1 Tax=Nitratireductor sp. B36 TaxID=2762059 RepID=UPI001E55BE54|nr:phosphoribosyltransferase [Nitratireductor sp. B36]MCC5777887.1 phosphoribosyltransferase [Nitratireductor sp. B36]